MAFYASQGIAGLNFGACLLTSFKFFVQLSRYHQQDQKHLSAILVLSPIPFGLLISVCAMKVLFKIDNTYFTNTQTTLDLIGFLNLSLALLGILSVIFVSP